MFDLETELCSVGARRHTLATLRSSPAKHECFSVAASVRQNTIRVVLGANSLSSRKTEKPVGNVSGVLKDYDRSRQQHATTSP